MWSHLLIRSWGTTGNTHCLSAVGSFIRLPEAHPRASSTRQAYSGPLWSSNDRVFAKRPTYRHPFIAQWDICSKEKWFKIGKWVSLGGRRAHVNSFLFRAQLVTLCLPTGNGGTLLSGPRNWELLEDCWNVLESPNFSLQSVLTILPALYTHLCKVCSQHCGRFPWEKILFKEPLSQHNTKSHW